MTKRRNLGPLESLIIVAGGFAGAAFGWDSARESLARYAAKAGHIGTDSRGPVILGYMFVGLVAGTIVTYLLVSLWRRFQSRKMESRIDEP